MKKLKSSSILFALALVAAGCSESQDIVDNNPNATPGEEVQFGSSLSEGAITRTVYGEPSMASYPVYWVQGDKVQVTSPQCMSEYNNRVYSVNVESETQNYATGSLQKTTDTGIRWGEDGGSADFYSIYPSSGVDKVDASLTKFTLTMPQEQHITLKTTTGADGTVSHVDYAAADMDACFMWAKTANVASGETVNLQYTPLSTALRFKLQGPSDVNADPVTVKEVKIKATTQIYGDFDVELSGCKSQSAEVFPTVSEITDGSEEVTIIAQYENGTYLTLNPNETAELNAFIIPQDYRSIVGWTITVNLNDGSTFSREIKETDLNGNNSLAKGQVHNLGTLPALSKQNGAWDVTKWMTSLHDQVYLSEVSIPGSWNSLNPNFQSNTSINEQYAKGCRAFHLDTRWKKKNWIGTDYTLGVCNNGSTAEHLLGGGKVIENNSSAPTFTSALSTITDNVKNDEYMVVLCTFAQDSYAYNGSDGWIKAVSSACANNDKVIDASTINSETTVGEVEGYVIVIICTDDETLTLPSGSKCMITYLPNTIEDSNAFDAATHHSLENASSNADLTLYGSQAQITSNKDAEGIDSDRGYAPYLTQRKNVAQEMLDWSSDNYDSKQSQAEEYHHNQWMLLGLGGYLIKNEAAAEADNGTYTIASELNPWIEGKIDEMATNKQFFPVGIVLMNHVCETAGTSAMDAIVQLNTKYEQAKAASSTASSSNGVKAHTQATYTGGGNAISH